MRDSRSINKSTSNNPYTGNRRSPRGRQNGGTSSANNIRYTTHSPVRPGFTNGNVISEGLTRAYDHSQSYEAMHVNTSPDYLHPNADAAQNRNHSQPQNSGGSYPGPDSISPPGDFPLKEPLLSKDSYRTSHSPSLSPPRFGFGLGVGLGGGRSNSASGGLSRQGSSSNTSGVFHSLLDVMGSQLNVIWEGNEGRTHGQTPGYSHDAQVDQENEPLISRSGDGDGGVREELQNSHPTNSPPFHTMPVQPAVSTSFPPPTHPHTVSQSITHSNGVHTDNVYSHGMFSGPPSASTSGGGNTVDSTGNVAMSSFALELDSDMQSLTSGPPVRTSGQYDTNNSSSGKCKFKFVFLCF